MNNVFDNKRIHLFVVKCWNVIRALHKFTGCVHKLTAGSGVTPLTKTGSAAGKFAADTHAMTVELTTYKHTRHIKHKLSIS